MCYNCYQDKEGEADFNTTPVFIQSVSQVRPANFSIPMTPKNRAFKSSTRSKQDKLRFYLQAATFPWS